MAYQAPPIAKATRRLRAELETAVRAFPRFHRYDIGTDIRAQVRKVQGLVSRAWQEKAQQAFLLQRLKQEIDQLKMDLQAAKDVHAFRSFRQFEALYVQLEDIGRQAGGWLRNAKRPSAQNAAGRRAVPQRGQILSTHATPTGVNP